MLEHTINPNKYFFKNLTPGAQSGVQLSHAGTLARPMRRGASKAGGCSFVSTVYNSKLCSWCRRNFTVLQNMHGMKSSFSTDLGFRFPLTSSSHQFLVGHVQCTIS
ncbi:hypothetical protein VNO80_22508 [Phaseolus coccineus]|uniref:Uncharacterized protein n=1 Tax=Phaseolus coccineus TaxID=3886 RepID=A0AAN9MAL9_PHACN